jgi:hypothetical protein
MRAMFFSSFRDSSPDRSFAEILWGWVGPPGWAETECANKNGLDKRETGQNRQGAHQHRGSHQDGVSDIDAWKQPITVTRVVASSAAKSSCWLPERGFPAAHDPG